MNTNPEQLRRRRRKIYPDGMAIEPREILHDDTESSSCSHETNQARQQQGCEGDAPATADLFVTMCFFARLGFIQPPSCLKCAYKSSGCGKNPHKKESTITAAAASTEKCNELVPWRIDANIPLHPDQLEGNVVFVTCNTARCLVNGDAYPSIRWDAKKKQLIVSDRRQTI